MKKKSIRLTESDLRRIVMGSVKKVINEIGDTRWGAERLGALAGRAYARGNNALGDEAEEYYDNIYSNTPDSKENDENYNEFWLAQDKQYYYESMLRDKDFLRKMIPAYSYYLDGDMDTMLKCVKDIFVDGKKYEI